MSEKHPRVAASQKPNGYAPVHRSTPPPLHTASAVARAKTPPCSSCGGAAARGKTPPRSSQNASATTRGKTPPRSPYSASAAARGKTPPRSPHSASATTRGKTPPRSPHSASATARAKTPPRSTLSANSAARGKTPPRSTATSADAVAGTSQRPLIKVSVANAMSGECVWSDKVCPLTWTGAGVLQSMARSERNQRYKLLCGSVALDPKAQLVTYLATGSEETLELQIITEKRELADNRSIQVALECILGMKRKELWVCCSELELLPPDCRLTVEAMCKILDVKPEPRSKSRVSDYWQAAGKELLAMDPRDLAQKLADLDAADFQPEELLQKLRPFLDNDGFNPDIIAESSVVCAVFCAYCHTLGLALGHSTTWFRKNKARYYYFMDELSGALGIN